MPLDRPIFIVGSGRCGSTIFHKIFTYHPRVTFLSGLCKRWPDKPQRNRLAMRLMDVPLLRRWARKKFQPAEHWDFWETHVKGFSRPCRDLTDEDVRPHVQRRITKVLEQMLTPRRDRLLVKLTGWPRMRFLSEVFPDARFIHMIRDGRAVSHSLLDVPFWRGWEGPAVAGFGELSPAYQEEWERSGRSFLVLAAIQWKILMECFEEVKQDFDPARFLEVRYEDFAADPAGSFTKVLDFCGLDYPASFRDRIGQFTVESANYKWKEQLTPRQQELLRESLAGHLRRYGYEAEVGGRAAGVSANR
jgi:hypothetical protein